MEWVFAYIVIGVAVCVIAGRIAKKHSVDTPDAGYLVLLDGFGILLFAFWPVVLPVWVWLEIGAKKLREKETQRQLREEELKRTNPYYGLTMDEQIDKLREIHNQLERTGENQMR